jgi:CMP-N-acetylneuraminic acid synthetase
MWGCAQTAIRRIIRSLTESKGSNSQFKPRLEQEHEVPRVGGTMPEIENVQESVQHCFELAASSGLLEEDLASEAFELLIANDYDRILAHALGVSL